MATSWPTAELLGVERDGVAPKRVTGSFRVGGCPCRVTLDFGREGLAEYIEMPGLVNFHPALTRAVVALLSEVVGGGDVKLGDISELVRAKKVWPDEEVCPFEHVTLVASTIVGEEMALEFRAEGDERVRRLAFVFREDDARRRIIDVDDQAAFDALSTAARRGLVEILIHLDGSVHASA